MVNMDKLHQAIPYDTPRITEVEGIVYNFTNWDLAWVNIPKNNSQRIAQLIAEVDNSTLLNITGSLDLTLTREKCFAIIRNPYQRFASAIVQNYASKLVYDLALRIEDYLELFEKLCNFHSSYLAPQVMFLPKERIDLILFENHGPLLERYFIDYPEISTKVSDYIDNVIKFEASILRYPRVIELTEKYYQADLELYESVKEVGILYDYSC